MFHTLQRVRIAAVRAAVPTQEIRLEDEAAYYGGSMKKVSRMKMTLGMDRRRVCPVDVTASDLCAFAAQNLLATPGVDADATDALIFVSQSPDWTLPATACELQHRLGLPQHCAAFDVNQGCAGYIYGLWIGSSLIASGAARQALLLVGDAHSFSRDVRNRITAPVFGDGGSATLLVRDETAPPMHFGLGTDGSGFETIIAPAGRSRIPFVREHERNEAATRDIVDPYGNPWQLMDTYMDGGRVFNFTIDVVPQHLQDCMKYAAVSPEELDWLFLHQANKQIVEGIADKVGVPLAKTPSGSFSRYGNTASASIPVALCDAAISKPPLGTILMSGYGVGLAWGSCLCSIDRWDCAPLLEYEADPARPTREQRIERWEKIIKGDSHD